MTAFVWLIPIAIVAAVLVHILLRRQRQARAEREGKIMMGTVLDVQQTGAYINNQPMLRVRLDAQGANGTHVQTTVKQVFSLIAPPRPGQNLAIVLNPDNQAEAFLADKTALQRDDRTAALFRMSAAVPAEMRDSKARIGDIAAITPLPDGRSSYQVEVVHLGQRPDTVFCNQKFAPGEGDYAVGDRVYLLTDKEVPPRSGYILPLSYSNGERIPNHGNRMDALVLPQELLYAGARAEAVVTAVEEQAIPVEYSSQGVTRWLLQVHVTPENGSAAYDATVPQSCSSMDKANRINQVGATVPVRYDPNDPQTLRIDSIAIGWGDPKLAQERQQAIVERAAAMHRAEPAVDTAAPSAPARKTF